MQAIATQTSTKVDWDNLLGDCDAHTFTIVGLNGTYIQGCHRVPAESFAQELIATYPPAKTVLTNRSLASWHVFPTRVIRTFQVSHLNRILLPSSDSLPWVTCNLMDPIIKYWSRGSITYSGIQFGVQPHPRFRDLLEFELGDGWNKSCNFVTEPLSGSDSPHVNESNV
ncbi:hypothetical protein BUE80_DR004848 [Diplocarpon rosae]|nr:hypothetical protein BUE80_DR004848 [Diplocarpon rosae]